MNGYALTWDLSQKNPRVRSFDLSSGEGEALAVAPLVDEATADHFAYFQEVRTPLDLPAIGVLRLSIASIYAGLGHPALRRYLT